MTVMLVRLLSGTGLQIRSFSEHCVTCYTCKIVSRNVTEIDFKSIVDGLQAGLFTELIFLEHYEPSIGIQK